MDFSGKALVFSVKKAAEPHIFEVGQSVLPKAVAQQDAPGPFGILRHQSGQFFLIEMLQVFVAVEAENPVVGSLQDRKVLGGAKSFIQSK